LSTTDGKKKKFKIDYKNLEISEICTDEKSRDIRFSRNVNLEKIYLYDGSNATGTLWRVLLCPVYALYASSLARGL
jgi:hypothetical protein